MVIVSNMKISWNLYLCGLNYSLEEAKPKKRFIRRNVVLKSIGQGKGYTDKSISIFTAAHQFGIIQ